MRKGWENVDVLGSLLATTSDKPTHDVALLVYRQPRATAPAPFTGLSQPPRPKTLKPPRTG